MASASGPGGQLDAPPFTWRIGSSLVMGLTGFISRCIIAGTNTLQVNGWNEFEKLLKERQDIEGRTRGLITVSNHLSVYDDPLIWGALPWRYHWSPNNLRWSLASHDLAFQSRFTSTFFSFGQTLPTHRLAHSPYGGLFQPTITQTIRLLSNYPFSRQSHDRRPPPSSPDTIAPASPADGADLGALSDPFAGNQLIYTTNGSDSFPAPAMYASRKHAWVHIFPEGRIHQHPDHMMRYFKWGVSRLILESEPCPAVVPIWLQGFDEIMHESRTFPRPVPRAGKNIVITFGDQVDTEATFGDLRRRWKELVDEERRRLSLATEPETKTPVPRRRPGYIFGRLGGILDRALIEPAEGSAARAADAALAGRPGQVSEVLEKENEKEHGHAPGEEEEADNLDKLGILTHRLKYGAEAVELRKECTMRVREQVLNVRRQLGLPDEDPKARWVDTWREEGGARNHNTEGLMPDGSWVRDI